MNALKVYHLLHPNIVFCLHHHASNVRQMQCRTNVIKQSFFPHVISKRSHLPKAVTGWDSESVLRAFLLKCALNVQVYVMYACFPLLYPCSFLFPICIIFSPSNNDFLALQGTVNEQNKIMNMSSAAPLPK